MFIRNLILTILGAVGLSLAVWRIAVRPSRLELKEDKGVHFPTVSGSNLDREELEFPRDFAGDLNLLFVPFLQRQQATVNTWIPFAQELEDSVPGLIYYELPTIDKMPMLSRTFVNEGMRAGIPDPIARQRTVTLYIDTAKFMQATDIPDKTEVHILLVDREGEILWRTTGDFRNQKGQELLDYLETQN